MNNGCEGSKYAVLYYHYFLCMEFVGTYCPKLNLSTVFSFCIILLNLVPVFSCVVIEEVVPNSFFTYSLILTFE